MSFDPGHELLGAGSLFDVRRVKIRGEDAVEKRILPRFRREPEARAALVREAQVLSAALHPGLPHLLGVGVDDKGPYLRETYVAGISIRQIVESWSGHGGTPPRLAGHVAREAFEVLAELHELAGPSGPLVFVHGDIGPDHVILGPAGMVRYLDFGASRIAGLATSLLGQGRGTLPFVAPEVARGDAPPDQAADVYALAATVLYLATGGPLCDAKDEAAMLFEVGTRGVRTALLDEAAAFRPAEKAALAAALATDPAARVRDARGVLRAFDA
ncbi:MAG: protein kinase [Polyangiaceae bacterium]